MTESHYKIGELAKRTGVSIRTLHHYDDIGLLSPSHRTESGHRVYGREEVVRLQQILSLRQNGFSLEQIRDALNGDFDGRSRGWIRG
jgi:MerR family transcriptional regulator, thiopeptide resistance regulator